MANKNFPHRLDISVLYAPDGSKNIIISSLKRDASGESQIPLEQVCNDGIGSALARARGFFADGVEKVNIHLVRDGMCSDAHYRRESDEGDVFKDEALRTLRYVQVG